MPGPNDEVVKMLHRRLRDSGKTIGGSSGRTLHDILQPVEAVGLQKLAGDIHRAAFRMRALAERFMDQHMEMAE
jgi:hypothetical protein